MIAGSLKLSAVSPDRGGDGSCGREGTCHGQVDPRRKERIDECYERKSALAEAKID